MKEMVMKEEAWGMSYRKYEWEEHCDHPLLCVGELDATFWRSDLYMHVCGMVVAQ
jgi:hypothetical protein